MLWGEREHRPWIFFLVFCCNANVLVCWFRLCWVSDVRPLFGAHPKIRAVIFISLYIFVAGVQLFSLSRYVSQPNKLLNPSRSLTFVWCRREDIFVSTPVLKIFLVIFNYRRHSLVIGWSTTSALAGFHRGQLAVLWTLFAFSSFSSSLFPSPESSLSFTL